MRATEVTYNSETKEYHPHLHILLMVKSTYFKGKGKLYRAGRMDGSMATINAVILYPVVNVKVVRPGKQGLKKAVLETAKYPVKPLNFKEIGDDEIVSVVSTLYYALGNTRHLSFGGLLKQIYQSLNADEENLLMFQTIANRMKQSEKFCFLRLIIIAVIIIGCVKITVLGLLFFLFLKTFLKQKVH